MGRGGQRGGASGVPFKVAEPRCSATLKWPSGGRLLQRRSLLPPGPSMPAQLCHLKTHSTVPFAAPASSCRCTSAGSSMCSRLSSAWQSPQVLMGEGGEVSRPPTEDANWCRRGRVRSGWECSLTCSRLPPRPPAALGARLRRQEGARPPGLCPRYSPPELPRAPWQQTSLARTAASRDSVAPPAPFSPYHVRPTKRRLFRRLQRPGSPRPHARAPHGRARRSAGERAQPRGWVGRVYPRGFAGPGPACQVCGGQARRARKAKAASTNSTPPPAYPRAAPPPPFPAPRQRLLTERRRLPALALRPPPPFPASWRQQDSPPAQ